MTAQWSRRDFIASSGALVVSVGFPSLMGQAVAQGPFGTRMSHIDPARLDSWIAVASDGSITAYTGKCDFGQGMFTAQTQLIAEELCVPISRVRLIQCDTAITPDQGVTSGSQSTPTNFNEGSLGQAAATARETLVKIASRRLGVPITKLTTQDGFVRAKNGRKLSYGQLVAGKKFNVPLDAAAKRRSADQWTVLGKSIPPLEMRALITGQFEFVHNIHLPGMLHGRVVRPPAVGATVVSVDESSVRAIKGLVKVVVVKNFVGVVAEKQAQAAQAAEELKVVWTAGSPLPASQTFYDYMRKQPSRDVLLLDSQDVEQKLSGAASVLKGTYSYPYQSHGSIGASCAVADVQPGKATVWSATQSVYPTRAGISKLLELPVDDVRVVFVRGSGCYGLNGADSVSFDAALLSRAVQRPVRVQLTRQDEMAWGESYGSACVVEQRAALDTHGGIVAWECEPWSASLGGRPTEERPGNVITGTLAGYEAETVVPQAFSRPTGSFNNHNNAVPSYFAGCVGTEYRGGGNIRSERVLVHTVNSPFFTGPLRSPLRLQNTFAHECFMDELSSRANADPVAFRLRHLREPRLIDVVKAAAKAATWSTRPSPKSTVPSTGAAQGRGIACVAYEGANGYVALVAEVEVDVVSGGVQVTRFFAAHDCGPMSNPDGVRNQIEGGLLQGMSRALGEEITWNDHQITSSNWKTYHSLYLGMNVPVIECVLINRPDAKATGAGETAITVTAAAIGNAIFDATGIRLRQVPFNAERIKAALTAKS